MSRRPASEEGVDAGKIRRALAQRQVKALADKQASGRPLSAGEMTTLDAALDLLEPGQPGEDAAPPGAPPDVRVATKVKLAELCGIHRNSVTNWERAGVDLGAPPWSLRDVFLLLRRHGKLGETKPRDKKAQALRSWCFGNGDADDPNDPAHAKPEGWQEEIPRQTALRTLVQRQRERVEFETMMGERIPIDEYRARWRKRAAQVLTTFDRVMKIPGTVPDMNEVQRQALVKACRAAIQDMRTAIAAGGVDG